MQSMLSQVDLSHTAGSALAPVGLPGSMVHSQVALRCDLTMSARGKCDSGADVRFNLQRNGQCRMLPDVEVQSIHLRWVNADGAWLDRSPWRTQPTSPPKHSATKAKITNAQSSARSLALQPNLR